MSANVVGMCCGPAGVDLHIAADVPAQLPQPLQERPSPGLIISIVRACGQEHADPPHLVSRLLRARRQWPSRPAPEQCDELAPSQVEHGAFSWASSQGAIKEELVPAPTLPPIR